MMRFRGFAFLSFLLALVSFSAPARAAWIEGTTQHFTFYGDMSPDAMRRFAERLERYDAALRRITGAHESSRVDIYLLPLGDVQTLHGPHSEGIYGFYQATAQNAYAFVALNDPSQGSQYGIRPIQVLFHEYAHHMLLGNVDQTMPGWANEGMAELFMTVQFGSDGSLTFGAPSLNRGFAVMAADRFSLQDLLLSDSRQLSPEQMDQKYGRGWLLVHYLLLSGNRPGQFARFITLLNQAVPVLDAARQAFGDLDQLNAEFDRYRNQTRFRGFRVTAEQLGPTPQVTIRPLRPGEAAIMPLRMRSVRGVDQRSAAQLVPPSRSIAAQYPDDLFVQRALAEMEWDANNLAQSEAAADRVLALEPSNVMGMVYKARVIGRRAYTTNNAALWRDARSWILRANRLDSNFALPLELYYDSFIAAHEPPPEAAVNALLRAIVLVPQDSGLRLRLAVQRLRAGDLETTRRVIAPLAFSAHSRSDNPAMQMVTKIDAHEPVEAVLRIATAAHFDGVNDFYPPDPPTPPAQQPPAPGATRRPGS
jgi:hypothetical protein